MMRCDHKPHPNDHADTWNAYVFAQTSGMHDSFQNLRNVLVKQKPNPNDHADTWDAYVFAQTSAMHGCFQNLWHVLVNQKALPNHHADLGFRMRLVKRSRCIVASRIFEPFLKASSGHGNTSIRSSLTASHWTWWGVPYQVFCVKPFPPVSLV